MKGEAGRSTCSALTNTSVLGRSWKLSMNSIGLVLVQVRTGVRTAW